MISHSIEFHYWRFWEFDSNSLLQFISKTIIVIYIVIYLHIVIYLISNISKLALEKMFYSVFSSLSFLLSYNLLHVVNNWYFSTVFQ